MKKIGPERLGSGAKILVDKGLPYLVAGNGERTLIDTDFSESELMAYFNRSYKVYYVATASTNHSRVYRLDSKDHQETAWARFRTE